MNIPKISAATVLIVLALAGGAASSNAAVNTVAPAATKTCSPAIAIDYGVVGRAQDETKANFGSALTCEIPSDVKNYLSAQFTTADGAGNPDGYFPFTDSLKTRLQPFGEVVPSPNSAWTLDDIRFDTDPANQMTSRPVVTAPFTLINFDAVEYGQVQKNLANLAVLTRTNGIVHTDKGDFRVIFSVQLYTRPAANSRGYEVYDISAGLIGRPVKV